MKCSQNCTPLISPKVPLSRGLVLSRLIDLKFLPAYVGSDHAQIISREHASKNNNGNAKDSDLSVLSGDSL